MPQFCPACAIREAPGRSLLMPGRAGKSRSYVRAGTTCGTLPALKCTQFRDDCLLRSVRSCAAMEIASTTIVTIYGIIRTNCDGSP